MTAAAAGSVEPLTADEIDTRARERMRQAGLLLVASGVFLVHAALFRDWIIDDAGITFAYARNLVDGYGLVAQPGAEPVEAYSNFLWLLVVTPLIKLGIFEPVLASKLLSCGLVLLSFLLLNRTLSRQVDVRARRAAFLVPLFLALNPPFVIWTTSGLENPLLIFLLCLSLDLMLRVFRDGDLSGGYGAVLGALAAAVAMTRPDGIVFVAAFPVVAALRLRADDLAPERRRDVLRATMAYGLSFSVLFGAFMAFRVLYFHEIVPNTYWAKGDTELDFSRLLLLPLLLARSVLALTWSMPGGPLVLLVLAAGARRAWQRREVFDQALLVFTLLAGLEYVVLPADWMGEFRFATPFVLFATVWAVRLFASGAPEVAFLTRGRVRRDAFWAVMVLILLLFGSRSIDFSKSPPTSFSYVEEKYAVRFDGYAERLGLADASVLLPDLGATLYYSHLRVYDLAGLADKTIARTIDRDDDALRDYVFETAKPTFIVSYGPFVEWSLFDTDPRFREAYVPLCEDRHPWLGEVGGVPIYAGEYVRREAVIGTAGEALLADLRGSCLAEGKTRR